MTQPIVTVACKGRNLFHSLVAANAAVQAHRAGIVARELTGAELPTEDALEGARYALDVIMSKAPVPYALTDRALAAPMPVLRRIK